MKQSFFVVFVLFALAINSVAQQTPTADAILQKARTKAAKENKKVMVIFHASWCGWCRKMDTSLNDVAVKGYFDRNFVITHLTIDESPDKKNNENPGAKALNIKWGGEDQGIPFWVIMDKDGNVLADSQIEPGKNTGCPASAEEVAHLINVLKKTSSISDEEIAAVEQRFRRNE